MIDASERLRVMIVDDHAHFREGLRALLGTAPDLEVVAEAGNGEAAIRLAAEFQPDVILMDLNMPGIGGVEATRQILFTSPHIAVLVISMADDDDSVFAALKAGARGYVLKGAGKTEIVQAIRSVANGGAIFGPAVARRLIGFFAVARPFPSAEVFPELTEREREILGMVAKHRTNPEIARDLYLSPKTVRNHVSNIFAKLQVADRAEAIIRARDAGMG